MSSYDKILRHMDAIERGDKRALAKLEKGEEKIRQEVISEMLRVPPKYAALLAAARAVLLNATEGNRIAQIIIPAKQYDALRCAVEETEK